MTAMLLIGIAIAVLLYIVVQRLDRIIALQLHQRDLQRTLIHIADLLEVPYGEELDRKRVEKEDRALDKTIADFAKQQGIPVPEPHRPQRPPKG